MNRFEKQLEKWNGGVLRGAQAKLARLLRVSTATVALWATGKRRPSKGYVAQMAQLFGLDAYDVIRLFPANTTYPDLQHRPAPRSLRDAQSPENTYSADKDAAPFPSRRVPARSNSISLPFLTHAPQHYPQIDEGDVAEWWTLPLRCAKGAKFLIREEQTDDRALYFIRPEETLLDGKWMLLQTPAGYTVKRIHMGTDGKILLYTAHNTLFGTFAAQQVKPLGVAVQKITDLE